MGINDIVQMLCAKQGDPMAELVMGQTAEIVRCGMEFARKYPRKNDRWDIVWAIPVSDDTEIVIGDRHTDFQPFVAWHCFRGNAYSWGHYCNTFGGAFDCALEKIRKELKLD